MHNESFLFSQQLIGKSNFKTIIFNNNFQNKIDFSFITVNEGIFVQGWHQNSNMFTFDNEMPPFQKKIKKFNISKYPITNLQYLQFLQSGGYENEKYWCTQGWNWVQENKICKPLYWIKKNNIWFTQKWKSLQKLYMDHPVIHISWFEACAFCKWSKTRLPTESEWEFVATNFGKNNFPWGDEITSLKNANLDYKYMNTVSVYHYENDYNKHQIQQIIGNCWEWCQEPIYPYDGFKIDPVYREMSYPFFGYKKICRGGSWAVPSFLINSKYRNAQMPDNRIQYIGFRVCKDN